MDNITETIKLENEAFKKYCSKRMAVQKEFIKQYYGILTTSANDDRGISFSHAFELLNKLQFDMYGKYKFINYGLFMITRIRLVINLAKGRILFALR